MFKLIDISILKNEKTKLDITQRKKQEEKYELDSTIIPYENHTLYQINVVTLEITPAKFKKRDYLYNPNWKKGSKISSKGEVIKKAGMAYVSALTKTTALNKFNKGCNGTKLDPTKTYAELC